MTRPQDNSRHVNRHRRISAPDNYHPTVARNMSSPDLINEYDVTKNQPIETSGVQSSKHNYSSKLQNKFSEKAEYTKYADKYSLTKNCKYYKELQLSKLKQHNEELLEQSKDIIEPDDYEEFKSKIGHRRVVSANYNSGKILMKRERSPNLDKIDTSRDRNSKSTERNATYHNYISNQNPVTSHEYMKKKYKKLKSKRGSCQNSKVSSQQLSTNVSQLNLTMNESIIKDRQKLIKYITLYTQKHDKIPSTTLDYYKIVKLIGKGAFGKVTLGIHKLTGKQVAIKTIEKSYMKDDFSRKKVFQEVYILKKIRHSNIIRLFEVFESTNHLLMVMEYAGKGDLLQHVKSKGRLKEKEARYFFKHILYGLGH